MRKEQLDVVFIGTSVANPEGVVVDPLLTETMVVALPSGHPLARRATDAETALSLKALADETFILFGRPQGAMTLQSNTVVSEARQAAGFNPRVGMVVPHISSRFSFVAAGLGVAIVAASLQRMNNGLQLIDDEGRIEPHRSARPRTSSWRPFDGCPAISEIGQANCEGFSRAR